MRHGVHPQPTAPRGDRLRGRVGRLLALGIAALALANGCAPGLDERLEAAQEYTQGKLEETEAFFRTNTAPLTLETCRELAHKRT